MYGNYNKFYESWKVGAIVKGKGGVDNLTTPLPSCLPKRTPPDGRNMGGISISNGEKKKRRGGGEFEWPVNNKPAK